MRLDTQRKNIQSIFQGIGAGGLLATVSAGIATGLGATGAPYVLAVAGFLTVGSAVLGTDNRYGNWIIDSALNFRRSSPVVPSPQTPVAAQSQNATHQQAIAVDLTNPQTAIAVTAEVAAASGMPSNSPAANAGATQPLSQERDKSATR